MYPWEGVESHRRIVNSPQVILQVIPRESEFAFAQCAWCLLTVFGVRGISRQLARSCHFTLPAT
jgi:hypothetical protein